MRAVQVILQMHPPCREEQDHARCEAALTIEGKDHKTVAVCTCSCHWHDFDAALAARGRSWNVSGD